MTVQIVPRNSWARTPKNRRRLANFDHGWFIHWLGTPANDGLSDVDVLRQTQAYHMDTKRWSDIAYSFAIGRYRPERVYELRGWGIAGGHTEGYNSESMALVFLLGEGEKPTAAMLNTAREFLLGPATEQGYPPTLLRPHNAVRSTACPGPELTAWAKAGLKPTGATTVPTPTTPLPENHPGARIQRAINDNGLTPPLKVDGAPGPLTADGLDAVLAYLNGVVADLSQANATSAETIKRLRGDLDEAADGLARLNSEADRLLADKQGLLADLATLRSAIVADVVADIRAAVAKLGA